MKSSGAGRACGTSFNRLDEKLDCVADDRHNLKVRAASMEEAVAGVNRRFDLLDGRMPRVEKRLDSVEA